ncbi:hypothetical protein [Ferruginibacter sp.]
MFQLSLAGTLAFSMVIAYGKWQVKNQHKIIVYNVQQHQAIDIVNANQYNFIGDSALLVDGMLQNFHLKPARVALQLEERTDSTKNCWSKPPFYQLGNKRILLIDQPLVFEPGQEKIHVDMILLSRNPKLYIPQLATVFDCDQYVADASNSLWKIEKWKKDCEQLHLHLHSVAEKGAFILDFW